MKEIRKLLEPLKLDLDAILKLDERKIVGEYTNHVFVAELHIVLLRRSVQPRVRHHG